MTTEAPSGLMTLDDILREGAKEQAHVKALVREHEKYLELLIYPGGGGYPIEYYRMNTPERVLWWVLHLVRKRNVTKEHLDAFLMVAKERGVEFQYFA